MNTHIYFIRHGETHWNQEGRHQGHIDISLSETGLKQAELLADHLEVYSFAAIYSSDLTRARQTAEQIAQKHGLTVQTNAQLRERCGGEWEGLTIPEVQSKYPDWEQVRYTGGAYGVEATEKVKERMHREVIRIVEKHRGEQVVIVGHGMSLNALFSVLTDDEIGLGKTRLHNTSITHFSYHPEEGWTYHKVNDTPHLMVYSDEA